MHAPYCPRSDLGRPATERRLGAPLVSERASSAGSLRLTSSGSTIDRILMTVTSMGTAGLSLSNYRLASEGHSKQ